jgi:hypothetical protein
MNTGGRKTFPDRAAEIPPAIQARMGGRDKPGHDKPN